jgi:nitronate monooxygenase
VASNKLLQRLGVENPIIQAPMAGGPSTPELAAAVSNAGGLGSLGGAYSSPEQIVQEIQRTRALTSKPFSVNLFCGGYDARADGDAAPMLALLADIHQELGLPAPTLPKLPPDPFPRQLDAVIEAGAPVFSFTFGIPDHNVIKRLKARDIAIIGTATTVEEARMLEAAGVEAIAGQGAEAGAHRGTFARSFEQSMVPTLELVRGIAAACSVPVIASGGIMDGRDIAKAMAAGASAVQLGTAFLACPESGASTTYKRAVLEAREDTTEITRAFSGRPARGLRNSFMAMLKDRKNTILPFPLQNTLTRAMRTAAAKQGKSDYLSLWAGTGVARIRSMPAAELVQRLVEEIE